MYNVTAFWSSDLSLETHGLDGAGGAGGHGQRGVAREPRAGGFDTTRWDERHDGVRDLLDTVPVDVDEAEAQVDGLTKGTSNTETTIVSMGINCTAT